MNQMVKADPAQQFRQQLAKLRPEFANALPSHIAPEKFQRVVQTVVQQTPDLLAADRRSLFGACMKCAADGLVPDGREAALVLFSGKVQYMPMVAGLLKRARNTGEIVSLSAHVVHERDEFTYELGDEERIVHKPRFGEDRGKMIAAYAIARLKDGGIVREVMAAADIEKVRNVSRAKNSGPWTQWTSEMWRKTVIRRISKYLPMDADAERALQRDDGLGAPNGDADAAAGIVIEGEAVEAASSRLDALEGAIDGEAEPEVSNATDADLLAHAK